MDVLQSDTSTFYWIILAAVMLLMLLLIIKCHTPLWKCFQNFNCYIIFVKFSSSLLNTVNKLYKLLMQHKDCWILQKEKDEVLPNYEQSLYMLHHSDDRNLVRSVGEHLEKGGYRVCIPERNFPVGGLMVEQIITALDQSTSVVIFMSERLLNDHWSNLSYFIVRYLHEKGRISEVCVIDLLSNGNTILKKQVKAKFDDLYQIKYSTPINLCHEITKVLLKGKKMKTNSNICSKQSANHLFKQFERYVQLNCKTTHMNYYMLCFRLDPIALLSSVGLQDFGRVILHFHNKISTLFCVPKNILYYKPIDHPFETTNQLHMSGLAKALKQPLLSSTKHAGTNPMERHHPNQRSDKIPKGVGFGLYLENQKGFFHFPEHDILVYIPAHVKCPPVIHLTLDYKHSYSYGYITPVISLEPHGTQFGEHILLVLPIHKYALPDNIKDLALMHNPSLQGDSSEWIKVSHQEPLGHTQSCSKAPDWMVQDDYAYLYISHFSDYCICDSSLTNDDNNKKLLGITCLLSRLSRHKIWYMEVSVTCAERSIEKVQCKPIILI